MQKTKIAAAAAGLLLLTGCNMSGLPVVGGMFPNDYFPMKKDAVWFYLQKNAGTDSGRQTIEVTSTATNGDTTMANMNNGGWVAKKVKDKLILGVGSAKEEFQLPPKEGATWTFTINNASVTGKIAAKENLTLPYGNVNDAYRLEYTDKDNKPTKGSLGYSKIWLSSNIGLVKLEQPDPNDSSKLITLELESYQIP